MLIPSFGVSRIQDLSDVGIGLRANRPAASAKKLYICTDTGEMFISNGSAWVYQEGAASTSLTVSRRASLTDSTLFFQQLNTAAAFTTIQLQGTNGTISDPGANYNASTYIYTVPVAGVYFCQSKLRLSDAVPANLSYGQGIHTSNVDTPSFSWFTSSSAAAARNGSMNIRISPFNAGDQLRMYAYVDNATLRGVYSAEMSITLISN